MIFSEKEFRDSFKDFELLAVTGFDTEINLIFKVSLEKEKIAVIVEPENPDIFKPIKNFYDKTRSIAI